MLNNSWFKKERPLLGLTGMAGGAAPLGGGGPAPGMEASGGVVAESTDPQARAIDISHTSTADGTLVITALSQNTDCPHVINYSIVAGGGVAG